MKRYDLIVIGAGPSGLSAAIEAAKRGLHVAVFDENGNCLDNAIVKANDILEDILIAEFDMDRIRAYREQETWGNAYRKPAAYTDLVSFEVKKPFIRNN